jgi:hypothetical protein
MKVNPRKYAEHSYIVAFSLWPGHPYRLLFVYVSVYTAINFS